jgi:hypothetical protein
MKIKVMKSPSQDRAVANQTSLFRKHRLSADRRMGSSGDLSTIEGKELSSEKIGALADR